MEKCAFGVRIWYGGFKPLLPVIADASGGCGTLLGLCPGWFIPGLGPGRAEVKNTYDSPLGAMGRNDYAEGYEGTICFLPGWSPGAPKRRWVCRIFRVPAMSTSILIVEDEAITALDLKHQLTTLGYQIAGVADTAEDAVRMAKERRPNLVLMDIRLGSELDGIVAASAIRGHDDLPIVFLTAHSDQMTVARALAASPFGYILKPFEVRELKVTIEIALYKHAREKESRELLKELSLALSKVKGLTGLLPICSGCKRIHDESGQWLNLEDYIRAHTGAGFSHGICPECMKRVYPEYAKS
jgi:CheY-like chemotaxis protein